MMRSEELPSASHDASQSAYKRNSSLIWAFVLVFPLAYCVYAGLAPCSEKEDAIKAATFILVQKVKVFIVSSIVFVLSLWTMKTKSEIPDLLYDSENETWFGHRMSRAGEWENIPITLCATYSFVLSYGALVSLVAGYETHVLTVPAFYLVGLVAFYMWHVAAHEWESSELHRVHMLHHQVRYPQSDFYGDYDHDVQSERQAYGLSPRTMLALMNPTSSTTTTIAHEGPLVVAVVAIVFVGHLVFRVTILASLLVLLGFGFMSTFGSAVHMSFHERGFELEPYAWYRELRSLHMIHHMHRKNYAMVNVLLDIAFCSFLLTDH
jgi:hypothetical protein